MTNGQIEKVNIDGSDDMFYRYKMRQLKLVTNGRNKMVKTTLPNLSDVSHDLKIPGEYIAAFIGYTLSIKFGVSDGKYWLSGKPEIEKLDETMIKLIYQMVLCQKCNLPELLIAYEKGFDKLSGTCSGCGMKYYLPIKNDKFVKFIKKSKFQKK